MTVTLKIAKCKDCPSLEIGRAYSLNGFDRGADWTCSRAGRDIAPFVEWTRDEPKEIPDWCPLREDGDATDQDSEAVDPESSDELDACKAERDDYGRALDRQSAECDRLRDRLAEERAKVAAAEAEAARWRERCRLTGDDVVALGITTDDIRAWLTSIGWAPSGETTRRYGGADGHASSLKMWRAVPRGRVGVDVPDTESSEDIAATIRGMGHHLRRSPWGIADDIVANRDADKP